MNTFSHKYRWTREEIAVISVLFLFAVGLVYWSVAGSNMMWIAAISPLALGIYAWHIGYSRKKKSALHGEFDESSRLLTVGGHEFESRTNKVRVDKVASLIFKKVDKDNNDFSPRDQIVFTAPGTNLKVPLRLFSDPSFVELTQSLVSNKGDSKVQNAVRFGQSYRG